MKIVVSSFTVAVPFKSEFSSGVCWQASGYSVHPEGCDKSDGLMFPTVKEAQAAAMAWIKAPGDIAKLAEKNAKKAESAAARATRAVSRTADRLAAEAALLTAKKARLDEMNAKGVFSLSMVG